MVSTTRSSSDNPQPITLRGSEDVGTGAISFVQFFGSGLNVTPHFHIICLDGGYTRAGGGRFAFTPVRGFTTEWMFNVLYQIVDAVEGVLRRFGYVKAGMLKGCEEGSEYGDEDPIAEEPELDADIPLPFKPREPKSYRRKGRGNGGTSAAQIDPRVMTVKGWCNVTYRHFSLHAGVAISGSDRAGIKKLIRYTSRPAVSPSRLAYVDPENPSSSQVRLSLKKPWSDGTRELIFTQETFTQENLRERIAAIIPPSWFNLTRYFGIFAPGHAWRDFIIAPLKKERSTKSHTTPPIVPAPTASRPSSCKAVGEYWLGWADLLRRSLGINPEECDCGGMFVVQESVADVQTIAATMVRLGLSATPPPLGGRGEALSNELEYVFDCQ